VPRAIVTRPAKEAQLWVADLQARGIEAIALPLITIGAVPDPAALAHAWRTLAHYDAVMFVSGNAVQHFFAQRPAEIANPFGAPASGLRAWVTGPASQSALQEWGVPPWATDAPAFDGEQFDSEALWRSVSARVLPGYRVLIVRGNAAGSATADPAPSGVGRDWFAQQLQAAGSAVDFVVAYQRQAPVWDAAQFALLAQAACDGSVWIFSSAEAVGYLLASAPQQAWTQARAVATHPRIAQAARQAGFGTVWESRPLLAEVVASIESRA
jgi:uroporphyrinogen-III synthase